MNWIVHRAVKVGLVFSAAIGFAALAISGLRDALLEVYLLGIGGVLLLALVRTTSETGSGTRESDFDRAVADMSRRHPSDSGELTMVNDVQQSVASSFHLHTRLRPILREIAAHRLSMRFGVDLHREPDARTRIDRSRGLGTRAPGTAASERSSCARPAGVSAQQGRRTAGRDLRDADRPRDCVSQRSNSRGDGPGRRREA